MQLEQQSRGFQRTRRMAVILAPERLEYEAEAAMRFEADPRRYEQLW